jgi:hypothetical protein
MGGGIGQWLLFRAGDRSLTLFSLVVPPEAQTPVHDHLAWGLVGLYRGTQDERIYAEHGGHAEPAGRRTLTTATATSGTRRSVTGAGASLHLVQLTGSRGLARPALRRSSGRRLLCGYSSSSGARPGVGSNRGCVRRSTASG